MLHMVSEWETDTKSRMSFQSVLRQLVLLMKAQIEISLEHSPQITIIQESYHFSRNWEQY